jgi:ribA/ribD-fused uncharacterized protein
MSYVYLLTSGTKTYVGATTDPDRRLRQHNRELSGGARATQGAVWTRVLFISGIPDWTTALQLEWAWKHYTRKIKGRGVLGRISALCNLFEQSKCTKKARPYCEWGGPIFLNFSAGQEGILTKIEGWCAGSPGRGPQFRVSILPSVPQAFLSFKMSASKTSSTTSASSDLSALIKAITALAEQQATNNKLVASVLDRLTSGAPAPSASYGGKPAAPGATAEPTTKGKRGRKPKADKEPKVKAAPPPAEDGVVRFGSASDGAYKEFSSFFKAPFSVAGKEYISLANYFNAMKFAETDEDFSEDIRTQKNPALTRAKASSVKDHPPRADWDSARLTVMLDGLRAKFAAHPSLTEKLLATGESPIEATIEEEMRLKGFWSIGEDGAGTNHMGQLLMALRYELSAAGGSGSGAPKPKPAAPAKKPAAPAKGKAAPPKAEEADSDSDTDDEEDEAPTKPVTKAKVASAPVAKKPTAPPKDEEDSDSDEDDDDE